MYDPSKGTTPPRWIQGTWTVKVSYGTLRIVIKGRKVWESVNGGEPSEGEFYYHDGKLWCRFGEDSAQPFVYALDEERRLIDAGQGLFMEKVR